MLRTFIRLLGLLSLGAGFLAGIVDGTRSIASMTLEWMSLGAALTWLMPRQMGGLEKTVSGQIHPLLWDPLLINFLKLPATVALFALGFLLLWAGIDKRLPITAPQA
ncbi:MAG: hypothetical protein ACRCWF_10545 [Beijerinckiaceae bacterium]